MATLFDNVEEPRYSVVEHGYDNPSDNPALYVGTYHKYNCGSLAGMWVDLTTFENFDEFEEFCMWLHRDEEEPELMFQDFMNFPRDWYSESCFDEDSFEKVQKFAALDEDEQKAYTAYINLHGEYATFAHFEEDYIGEYNSGAEFAEEYCGEIDNLDSIPDIYRYNIDWESVWLSELRHDYDEEEGYYFRRR